MVYMKINNKEIDVNEIVIDLYNDNNMFKMRGNGIYVSDNQVKPLKKYGVDYKKYVTLSSLIFDIEKILNEETDVQDLEELSQRLSELNYYNNTNK